jgi:hypothetical protein
MAVGQRLDLEPLGLQQVAEQLAIEVVVLDNQNSFCHVAWVSPWFVTEPYSPERALAIIREPVPDADPTALALGALAFVLGDEIRRDRFLALTGLTGDALRAGLRDPAILGAVLEFLANHEADLVAAAAALDIPPETLAAAWERLR